MRNNLMIATAIALALAGCKTTDLDPAGTSLTTCNVGCAPPAGGGGGGGGGGSGGGGGGTNTTTLTTGDTTVALETSALVSPAGGSLSQLTLTPASGANPATASFQIDTRSANNGSWPATKTMNEYAPGTASSGGLGMGGTYSEYRALSSSAGGTPVDEELQVWSWGNSYAVQYRDATGGGEAKHQAWSFGGNRTASMPNAGTATYNGRFGATAKSWNWIEPNDGRAVTVNNLWRLDGSSQITADFAGDTITGTLTPERWNAVDSNGVFTDVDATNPADPNFANFMNDPIALRGTIAGNTYSGTAEIQGNWVNGDNPMYGGFFGPGASETTGVFSVLATRPAPTGGNPPINDDRRGYLQMSGAFHGQ